MTRERKVSAADATVSVDPGLLAAYSASAGAPELPEGKRLSARHRLGKHIGSGAFGDVYEAYLDDEPTPSLALKVLRQPSARAMHAFKQEFRSLADLMHENVVTMYELRIDGALAYLTMELIHGVSFFEYARPAGVLDLERLEAALRGLCAGLSALHRYGGVHGDLKPSNVLVETATGRVVIVDFGLAGLLSGLPSEAASGFRGTPAYAAPEQLAGAPASPASDWYAVGVMLCEALTGQLPGRDAPTDEGGAELQRGSRQAGLAALAEALRHPLPERRCLEPEVRHDLAVLRGPLFAQPDVRWVGRVRELQALERSFAEAGRGELRCVVVSGPSGIGKTALVRHFATAIVREHGGVVLSGRCYAQEHIPYRALDGVVDALCRELLARPELTESLRAIEDLDQAARLFPALLRVHGVCEAARQSFGRNDRAAAHVRARAARAIAALCSLVAAGKPVVLIVDDVHWDDADSAWLFKGMLESALGCGLLAILCVRDDAREKSAILDVLERHGEPTIFADDILLTGLSESDAAVLARQHGAGDDDGAGLPGQLWTARGHPLYVIELARWLRAERAEAHLPGGLADVVRMRCHSLPPAQLALLQLVCVAGHRLPAELAIAICGASALDMRRLTIDRLCALSTGEDDLLVEPYHDQIREALLRMLAPELARTLRARLASAMSAVPGARHDLIAVHFAAAGMAEQAARHALLAVQESESAVAVHRLPELLELALVRAPDGSRVALLTRLGDALARNGRAPAAARAYCAAAVTATPGGEERFRLTCAAMGQAFQGGDLPLANSLLRALDVHTQRPVRPAARSALLSGVTMLRATQGLMPPLVPARPEACDSGRAGAELRALEVAWAAMAGLLYGHHARAWHFAAVAFALSARLGRAAYYAPLLASFSTVKSLVDGQRRAPTEGTLARAEILADACEDGTSQALVAMVRVVYFLTTRQVAAAEASLERVLEASMRAQKSIPQSLSAAVQLTAAPVLFWAGSVARTCRTADSLVLSASQARDRDLELGLRALSAYRLLAADRADDAVADWLRVAELAPTHSALRDAHWGVLVGVYAGRFDVARLALDISTRRLIRGNVALRPVRVLHLWSRAILTLSAMPAGRDGQSQRRTLQLLTRAVAAHERSDAPFLLFLRAAQAQLAQERSAAGTLLAQAQRAFAAEGMRGYAASASLHLAELWRDTERGEMHGEYAERYFSRERIAAPRRWAHALLPGMCAYP